jgi:sec-independent protein translocase protein TatC
MYFADDIFGFLARPLTAAFPPGQGRIIYTKLYEAFFVNMKVALFAAFFVTFPYLANQIWAFVAPGLYVKEKRAFLPFLIATPILFTLGAALAYYIVMPTAFHWFLGFEGTRGGLKAEALPAMGDYLSLVMQFILAFGISFLLPVLLMLLNRAGLVSREQLVGARRYVIVLIFGVAAVATPPDIMSQIALAVPLLILFEGSLILMRISDKRAAKEKAAEEAKAAAEAAAASSAPNPAPALTSTETGHL